MIAIDAKLQNKNPNTDKLLRHAVNAGANGCSDVLQDCIVYTHHNTLHHVRKSTTISCYRTRTQCVPVWDHEWL